MSNVIDEELAKEPQENTQARMIVEPLSSLYNLKDFEEQAIDEILNSQPQECEWKENDDEGYYETSCDNLIILMDGTPKENKWEYCPYCGRKIKVIE